MKIFISYAHKDIEIVKQIVTILKNTGHEAWFDTALKSGQEWQTQLADEIASSDVFVYVMTANSAWEVSEWCHWEFVTAVEHQKPIMPLLLQKTNNNFKLPVVISRLQYADLTNGLDEKVIRKMLSDLQALHIKQTDELPAKPINPTGEPARDRINQTVSASGNARVNVTGEQNIESQTNIENQYVGEQPRSLKSVLEVLVGIATIIGVIVAIITILPEPQRESVLYTFGLIPPSATPTQTPQPTETALPTTTPTDQPTATQAVTATSFPTPVTPVARGIEDTVIHTGPGINFDVLIAWAGESLDILGISPDGGWYQVLLRDGRRGWVISSQNVVDVDGNRSIIPTVIVTHTPTDIPTNTPLPSDTSSPTLPATETHTPSSTPTVTNTRPATSTPTPTIAITASYPCDGTVINPDGGATLINIVYLQATESSQRGEALRVGTNVVIQRKTTDNNRDWYLIFDGTRRIGYVFTRFIQVSEQCPE